jgi:hypothetical protein
MDICFALALSSAVLLRVPSPLTLSWQHSVEHFRIEEDYRVRGDALVLAEVRTQGVGAGIDVPRDARFDGAWWHFTPELPALAQVHIANSAHAAGYTLCSAEHCQRLASDQALVMRPC